MLQRIQTIYLLLAALTSAGLIFLLPLWNAESGEAVFAVDEILILSLFLLSAVISLITIFLFKNRKLQFVLGRLNILLNLILLGLFVYWSLNISGESNISEKGIGMLIPVLSIVFLVLANKAIKKDEDLVKSVDRLR
jgi:cytochrome c biogenesis factor